MKFISIYFISFLLLLGCTPKDKQEEKNVKKTTKNPTADIVIPEDQVLPMEKRGGDFTLYGTNGEVNLQDYRGKVVAIYFGYTQCPDVCPTNLALLGAALRKLSEKELENIQGIFISVDPGRDTPEILADYTKYFHPNIIGASGTPEMIDPIVVNYGAFYEKVSYSNSAMLYGVSHTSETYIVGKNGKLNAILPHATPTDGIVKALKEALK